MEQLMQELIRKIDTLIKIQLVIGFEGKSQTEKVIALHGINLPPKEIAIALGITPNIVSALISQSKKAKKKK